MYGVIFFFFEWELLLMMTFTIIYILRLVYIFFFIWHRSDFNPLKYSRDVNSHPGRKTAFTQALELQGRKFKLNPCNASVEARTTSLTFVREWLWQTAFTQTLGLQGKKFKLNSYNASVEARTTFLTFVREWLWPLGLSLSSSCMVWLKQYALLAFDLFIYFLFHPLHRLSKFKKYHSQKEPN